MRMGKRSQERLAQRLAIKYGEPNQPLKAGYIKNMSSRGMAISCRQLVPIRTALKVEIEAKNNTRIHLDGIVRWVKEPNLSLPSSFRLGEMGIFFQTSPDAYIDFIHNILDEREDKRDHVRLENILKVHFKDDKDLLEEYTQNISLGGMYIVTDNPPVINSYVDVIIFLPNVMQSIKVQTRVVSSFLPEQAGSMGMNPGCGVQFIKFYDESEKALLSYINRLLNEDTASM